jgi:serine/threonine protein kinase
MDTDFDDEHGLPDGRPTDDRSAGAVLEDAFELGAARVGPYAVGKLLGVGGFGQVRLGIHTGTGQKAALKFIRKGRLTAAEAERIITEISCLSDLEHPNIVRMLGVMAEPHMDCVVIALEYAEGGDLKQYLAAQPEGKLSVEEACETFGQVARAVQHAHGKHGICHKDLKNENVLRTGEGRYMLSDFGLARFAKPADLQQTDGGTLYYAAPEALRGLPGSGSAGDVWALGCMLYSLLVGRLPFTSWTLDAVAVRLRDEEREAAAAAAAGAVAGAGAGVEASGHSEASRGSEAVRLRAASFRSDGSSGSGGGSGAAATPVAEPALEGGEGTGRPHTRSVSGDVPASDARPLQLLARERSLGSEGTAASARSGRPASGMLSPLSRGASTPHLLRSPLHGPPRQHAASASAAAAGGGAGGGMSPCPLDVGEGLAPQPLGDERERERERPARLQQQQQQRAGSFASPLHAPFHSPSARTWSASGAGAGTGPSGGSPYAAAAGGAASRLLTSPGSGPGAGPPTSPPAMARLQLPAIAEAAADAASAGALLPALLEAEGSSGEEPATARSSGGGTTTVASRGSQDTDAATAASTGRSGGAGGAGNSVATPGSATARSLSGQGGGSVTVATGTGAAGLTAPALARDLIFRASFTRGESAHSVGSAGLTPTATATGSVAGGLPLLQRGGAPLPAAAAAAAARMRLPSGSGFRGTAAGDERPEGAHARRALEAGGSGEASPLRHRAGSAGVLEAEVSGSRSPAKAAPPPATAGGVATARAAGAAAARPSSSSSSKPAPAPAGPPAVPPTNLWRWERQAERAVPLGVAVREIREAVLAGRPYFPPSLPALAVDLLRSMLHPDPASRPSVGAVLGHRWMLTARAGSALFMPALLNPALASPEQHRAAAAAAGSRALPAASGRPRSVSPGNGGFEVGGSPAAAAGRSPAEAARASPMLSASPLLPVRGGRSGSDARPPGTSGPGCVLSHAAAAAEGATAASPATDAASSSPRHVGAAGSKESPAAAAAAAAAVGPDRSPPPGSSLYLASAPVSGSASRLSRLASLGGAAGGGSNRTLCSVASSGDASTDGAGAAADSAAECELAAGFGAQAWVRPRSTSEAVPLQRHQLQPQHGQQLRPLSGASGPPGLLVGGGLPQPLQRQASRSSLRPSRGSAIGIAGEGPGPEGGAGCGGSGSPHLVAVGGPRGGGSGSSSIFAAAAAGLGGGGAGFINQQGEAAPSPARRSLLFPPPAGASPGGMLQPAGVDASPPQAAGQVYGRGSGSPTSDSFMRTRAVSDASALLLLPLLPQQQQQLLYHHHSGSSRGSTASSLGQLAMTQASAGGAIYPLLSAGRTQTSAAPALSPPHSPKLPPLHAPPTGAGLL